MEISTTLTNWLRRLVAQGTHIGAAGAGPLFLAQAGLLDGYVATIHWNYRGSFLENFPNIQVSNFTFEVDRSRFTCAGGTATMYLMLHAIAVHFGNNLASEVADIFITGDVNVVNPKIPQMQRHRVSLEQSPLSFVIDEMEAHIENPLSIVELAKRVNISQRSLTRMFREHFQITPIKYYQRLRLQHGRRLMQQTEIPTTHVAFASGFYSPEHFSRSYKQEFACSPTHDRHKSRQFLNQRENGE